ncbi:MAG: hypothetical protein ACRD88_10610, partial [Terriglobia bacterium]
MNRFAFPGIRTHSEFIYYLDDRKAVELLAEHRRIEVHPLMLEELSNNREKDYANAALTGKHMQLGFLKHQLVISRFHFMLEMASRSSGGQVQLLAWHQGAQIKTRVEVARVASRRTQNGNVYQWDEADD